MGRIRRQPLPKTLTVLVDTAEQTPLKFPERLPLWCGTVASSPGRDNPTIVTIKTRSASLGRGTEGRGDYTIEEYQSLVGVERKRGINELAANLISADRDRFITAFAAFLHAYKYPILFIDSLPTHFWNPNAMDVDPMKVLDRLLSTAALFPLDIVWGGRTSPSSSTRRRLGEILLRRMIHRALAATMKGVQP